MLRIPRHLGVHTLLIVIGMLILTPALGCGGDDESARNGSEKVSEAVAEPAAATSDVIEGEVRETMDSGGYTYVLVESSDGPVWAAAPQTAISVGDPVKITTSMPMPEFHSETLNRTFELVYFVTSFGEDPSGSYGGPNMSEALKQMHGGKDVMGGTQPSPEPAGGAKTAVEKEVTGEIEKAPGGLSVAEVYSGRSDLEGQEVTVRGVVVKFIPRIMGTNWLHIQDGTCAAGSCDLAVTSDAVVQVGDLVTLVGVLAVDKDFGAGYRYDVIVQGATLVEDG